MSEYRQEDDQEEKNVCRRGFVFDVVGVEGQGISLGAGRS